MNFDIKQFAYTNKKIIIWTVFFLLLYLMRDLFGLLFLTFILSFILFNSINWLDRKTRFGRRFLTALTYLVFVLVLIGIVMYAAPKLVIESKVFIKQIPETMDNVQAYLGRQASQQEQFAPLLDKLKDNFSFEALAGISQERILGVLVKLFNSLTTYISYFLVAILFSFLILFDLPKLKNRAMALKQTKLHDIYVETADSVIKFAMVVGETFQAQILVAFVNTAFTALGLFILDIHPIVVLATIVFFAGLVPVLGTFISSVPILLLAFNYGGVNRVLYALIMIGLIHTLEAYILNPRIVSALLKINPVMTLVILYIGGSLFGVWGVLLGVPVAVYVYRFAIKTSTDAAPEPE